MKTLDYRFTSDNLFCLKNLIDQNFNYLYSDNAFGGTQCFGNALFCVNNSFFSFNNQLTPLDYFGNGIEDVAVFSFEVPDISILDSVTKFERTIKIPVDFRITGIDIINESQKLFKGNTQTYDVSLTRGVIFHFPENYEVSFEKDIWFSESIHINRGYDLFKSFSPISEFENSWADGFTGKCERTIETL